MNKSESTSPFKNYCKNMLDILTYIFFNQGIIMGPIKQTTRVSEDNKQLKRDRNQLNCELQQKLAEERLWKSKYEQYLNQIISMKANYELEIKELSEQLKILNTKINAKYSKTREQHDYKKMMDVKQQENNILQENIKLLKDKIVNLENEKKYQLQELNEKNKQLDLSQKKYQDKENQLQKELTDKEQLRQKTTEHQQEYSHKQNNDRDKQSQSPITSNFSTKIELIDYEKQELIIQIKEKNKEIDSLRKTVKNLKSELDEKSYECDQNFQQKQYFERKNLELSNDVDDLSKKCLQLEREKIIEMEEIQAGFQLTVQHQKNSIKLEYDQKIGKLQSEIQELKRSTSLCGSLKSFYSKSQERI